MIWQRSLRELRKELSSHEGYPCITLTMPTARNMPDNAQDPVRLKNLVSEAKNRLKDEIGKRPGTKAVEMLELAADSVDHNLNYEGLAIFANEAMEVTLKTRFPLAEAVHVDDRFSLRAILRAERRAEPYVVLILSLDEARLYEGQREELTEIKDYGFPAQNSSYGAGAKVPSGPGVNATAAVDDSRRQFVKGCLDSLKDQDALPSKLVVMGTPELLSNAQEFVPSSMELIATIGGNYMGPPLAEIGQKVWEAVRAARQEMSKDLVEQLDAARSAQRFESGVQSLAPLAYQGRVDTLICGMDYQIAGRFNEATESMDLIDAPEGWGDIDDAVDWVVQQVLDKGGKVRFVEDELLGETPIAAILRY